jgi:hypothetical protein
MANGGLFPMGLLLSDTALPVPTSICSQLYSKGP